MRRQYHFRDSDKGLMAWDIDKLISITAGFEAESISLDAIRELDEPYWYSSEGDTPTCRSIADHMRLVQAVDLSYPIIIDPDGTIMDGMHRVVKAMLEERRFIRAYRLMELPKPDYIGVDSDDLPYDEA
jgi:hypothetical protein